MTTVTSQRIIYTSKRRTTGLTDCKITIKNQANTTIVNAVTMTELANGDYYYDYTPVSVGWHTWYADSDSSTSPMSGSFLSDYSTTTAVTGDASIYATTQELAQFMNIEGTVPNLKPFGSSRVKETVGTGDTSNTLFYLDYGCVIDGSYTLYYGSTESGSTALTETTHYTINITTGVITLTAAGVTLVSTNNIYASYSFCTIELTDEQLQDALDRAQTEIDRRTKNHWTDGTVTTPNYTAITKESQSGKGRYDKSYFLRNFPIPDVSTTLDGDLTAVATTVTVSSTNGFPSSGTINIGTEKITYTGKTTTTFTGCTRGVDDSTAVAADDGDSVFPYIVEISTTSEGNTLTWQVLEKNLDYDISLDTGKVYLYDVDPQINDVFGLSAPPRMTPNRFRCTYIWGNNTIPNDIKRLCLMLASKDVMHMAVRKAIANGMSDFKPDAVDIDENWIKETIMEYTNMKFYQT